MTTKKLEIFLTPTARTKLKEIYVYSCKEWGKPVAVKYMAGLENTIESVASGSKHPRINPKFSTRFSYITCKKHHIFFEYTDYKLIVATIFHASMSIKERMGEEMTALKKSIDKV